MELQYKHDFIVGDSVKYNKIWLDCTATNPFAEGTRDQYGVIDAVLPNGETIVVRWFNMGIPIELGYVHHTWLERING